MTDVTEVFELLDPYIQNLVDKKLGVSVNGRREPEVPENAILLYDGYDVLYYPHNEDGFDAAIAEAASGNRIWIPDGTVTFTGAKTIPAGVIVQGASRDGTILSYTGTTQNLITMSLAGTLENMTVNFTYTASNNITVRAIKADSSNASTFRNLTINAEVTGNAQELYGIDAYLYTAANKVLTSAENITVTAKGANADNGTYGGGGRRGAYLRATGGEDVRVINIVGYGINDGLDNRNFIGILFQAAGGSKIIAEICYGYGSGAADDESTATGLDLDDTELINSKGEAVGSGATMAHGIELASGTVTLRGCEGIASTSGTKDAIGILDEGGGVSIYSSVGIATESGSGSAYGIDAETGSIAAYDSVFSGGTYDIKVGSGDTLTVTNCTYSTTSITGTLTIGEGDRVGTDTPATTITGGGEIVLGGFTLTVPATLTAAGLAIANVFTAAQTINVSSTTALLVHTGGNNTLVANTASGRVGFGEGSPDRKVHLHNSAGATGLKIESSEAAGGIYSFVEFYAYDGSSSAAIGEIGVASDGSGAPFAKKLYLVGYDDGIVFMAGGTTAGDEIVRVVPTGASFIHSVVIADDRARDLVNSKMDTGLTINQGPADNEAFALKSSDIAHGMTTITETNTYYKIGKVSGAAGGIEIRGLSEATLAVAILGTGVTDDTTKASNAVAYVEVRAYKKTGTTASSIGSNANLFVIRNASATKIIFDAEGTLHHITGDNDLEIFKLPATTGAPTCSWLETPDKFAFNKGLIVGDGGATDYSSFEADGTLLMVGAATVFNDLQFAISNAKVPASNAPTWETFTTNTNEYGFGVDDYIDTQANEAPHGWKLGEAGNVHLHITTKAANSTGANRFAKFTVYVAYNDTGEAWQETSFTVELTIPDGTTALEQFYLDMGDLTLTNYIEEAEIRCRVKRIAATGGTEYSGNIFITQVGIHLLHDTIGSRTETAK